LRNKLLIKFLITSVIMCIVVFPGETLVSGEKPVIASRISEIIDVTVITDPDYYKPNTTLFGIDSEVEILNRDNETQTVIEQADCYPKVDLNATLVDQSLEIERIGACMDMFTWYYYQPNITVEYDLMMFYINQTGLSHLPDGNYTLWRYIEYGSPAAGIGTPGEILLTFINMNSGIMNVTYSYFDDNPHTIPSKINVTGATGLTIVLSSLLSLVFYSIVLKTRICKKRREKQ